MTPMPSLPTFIDYVAETTSERLETLKMKKNEPTQSIMIRMKPDFVDELDDCVHTMRYQSRSKFIRDVLSQRLQYFRDTEIPALQKSCV